MSDDDYVPRADGGNSLLQPDSLFGLMLTTHRDKDLGVDAPYFFQYECMIAAIAVGYFRMTIRSHDKEPLPLRLFFAVALASLAYTKKPYEIILAIQLFSYAVPSLLVMNVRRAIFSGALPDKVVRLLLIAASAVLSLLLVHVVLSDDFLSLLATVTPAPVENMILYLFPIVEFGQAYDIMCHFVDPAVLQKQFAHLLFVTYNIQVSMGFVGIAFLKREQMRRNELVRMDMSSDDDDDTIKASNGIKPKLSEKTQTKQLAASSRFQRGAPAFILLVAAPYMFQIIFFGNINYFAYTCLEHDIHRAVRLNQLFDHDSHLVAMANDSATSPEAYAQSMDVIISTTYDIFNRKLFSLPKLMLLPGIMMRQPVLVAQITPFIFASDFLKAKVVTFLTTRIEQFKKESMEVAAIRMKVESFDMKNADLLQRSGIGATGFTRKRWEELTVSIQQKAFMADFLNRTKRFFNWIQHHFVFSVMIDCALAQLIAVGKIMSAEIFVFSRAIEDAVDTVLMRSRAESELARMLTQIEKLKELATVWEDSRRRRLLPCLVAPPTVKDKGITLKNLHYSRGSASVSVDHVDILPGVYALTGANGSGKSTLFRVLMSCSSNVKSTDLPESIAFLSPASPIVQDDDPDDACAPIDEEINPEGDVDEYDANPDRPHHHPKLEITMPSSDVAEISQSFYWPLYTRPIDWIYQTHLSAKDDVEPMTRKVAVLLQDLEFRQIKNEDAAVVDGEIDDDEPQVVSMPVDTVMEELLETKDDWFNDLSGGQKSKVELVRKVFIQDKCPSVILIDETMAPLDPTSKSLVMSKLKAFCQGSVVIVIYHTDVMGADEEGGGYECVPGNNFFDANLHLENRTLSTRPLC